VRTIGFRYLADFRCLGSDCEDNCCGGWSVLVDEEHYHAIERLIPPEELARAFKRQESTDPQRYALMVLNEDNLRCSMLGADGLCTLHGRFGEEVIPNACAIFPRSAAVMGHGEGTHFELSATLSCPEIARRALLTDDGASLGELPSDRIVRGLLFKKLRGDEDLYHAGFEAVRGLMLSILSQRRVSVAARLFALAWFAEQTRPFLHDKAERADRDLIMKLFGLLKQPEALDRFQQELAAAQLNQPFPASVVMQVMVAAREDPWDRLLLLIDDALARDGSDPAAVLAAHRRRMAALPAQSTAVLELALEGFAKNGAFKDWYIKMPSLQRWVLHLVIRIAIVRYLFAAHPRAADDPGAAIVEIVYSLSRTFEHGDQSLARMLDDLEAQGMTTLGHAVALLTF
jgi:lysine-N-methylase